MSDRIFAPLRPGAAQAVAALVLATATATLIAVVSWSEVNGASRSALVGLLTFGVALVLGSGRVVGASSLPMLGGALLWVAASDQRVWVASMVVGLLWYVALELAWDSIERRRGGTRTSAMSDRRIQEVSTVVALSLVASIGAFTLSGAGPERSALVEATIVAGLLVVLAATSRHLTTHPAADD